MLKNIRTAAIPNRPTCLIAGLSAANTLAISTNPTQGDY